MWTDPAWLEGARGWIAEQVARLGMAPAGDVEQPHVRPWATVMRLPVRGGAVWFKAMSPPVADLVAAGVPDCRLPVLPRLFADLLDAEGLTAARDVVPRIEEACAELAATGIPATVDHCDLHDGQVFLDGGTYRFLDWGDASLSHPFLSLTVALRRTTSEGRVIDAYLEPWESFAPRAQLIRAAALGRVLGLASKALTWHRISAAVPEARRTYPHALSRWVWEAVAALA